jgi:hypothetical protein
MTSRRVVEMEAARATHVRLGGTWSAHAAAVVIIMSGRERWRRIVGVCAEMENQTP